MFIVLRGTTFICTLIFSYIDKNVSKVHIFHDCIVYNTALRYVNVNKNIPRLFVCFSVTVQSLSLVCRLETKYKL